MWHRQWASAHNTGLSFLEIFSSRVVVSRIGFSSRGVAAYGLEMVVGSSRVYRIGFSSRFFATPGLEMVSRQKERQD